MLPHDEQGEQAVLVGAINSPGSELDLEGQGHSRKGTLAQPPSFHQSA